MVTDTVTLATKLNRSRRHPAIILLTCLTTPLKYCFGAGCCAASVMVEVEAGPGDGSGTSGVPGSRSEDAGVKAGADGGGGGGGVEVAEVEDRETGGGAARCRDAGRCRKERGRARKERASLLLADSFNSHANRRRHGGEAEGRRVAGDKRGKSQLTEKGRNYFRNKVNISFHSISGKLQNILEKNMKYKILIFFLHDIY